MNNTFPGFHKTSRLIIMQLKIKVAINIKYLQFWLISDDEIYSITSNF